jgi:hypothetical protein
LRSEKQASTQTVAAPPALTPQLQQVVRRCNYQLLELQQEIQITP